KERRMERAIAFPTEEGERWVRDEMSGEQTQRRLPEWLLKPLLRARLYFRPPQGVPVRRWQHFGNWLQDSLCEYGENPWRLGLWALGLAVFSAVFYFLVDWASPEPVILALSGNVPRPPLEYLAFSFTSLAYMSFVRTEPAGT